MLTTSHKYQYAALLIAVLFAFNGCATTDETSEGREANPAVAVPAWAPPYDDIHFVRYYYLPDIEVYYDVWNQEFVYLQDGNWMFSTTLPPLYGGFDLYSSFVVVLDARVYEPWKYHHFYVSHYPRYYYHSVYNIVDTRDLRGFDENRERAIRLNQEDRSRLDEASRTRPGHEKVSPPGLESRRTEATRPPQRMRYYGQDIGKRVKVEKHMMRPRGPSRTGK
jgi:hypothetical protein